jgi:hypothetical protein
MNGDIYNHPVPLRVQFIRGNHYNAIIPDNGWTVTKAPLNKVTPGEHELKMLSERKQKKENSNKNE